MPFKKYVLSGGTEVTVYKRSGSRHLRLSVSPTGKVRVTIPAWSPYAGGVAFAQSREDWIKEQHRPAELLKDGQGIGKAHHLVLKPANVAKPQSRVNDTQVVVSYPLTMSVDDSEVQASAEKASIRALRAQAEQLLPQRLHYLAEKHGFSYRSVSIRQLKGRWGSCDQHTNITLNLFLMQLPWEAIDYVLLHELTHTKVMQHGPKFWAAMASVEPQTPILRKAMRGYHPVLTAT